MANIFERFAAAFPMVSDEAARWEKEGRLLIELAQTSGDGKGRVIDLACGNGFHARHLALEGFEVAGIELSRAMIRSGRALPGGKRVAWIEGDILEPRSRTCDLVLLLGNTLSLFKQPSEVATIFGNAAGVLVPNGALIVHIINYDFLKENPVRITRRGKVDNKDAVFEKRLEPTGHGAVIRLTLIVENGPKAKVEHGFQRLHEWPMPLLKETASALGFNFREEFGGLDRTPCSSSQSKDIVLVFQKTAG